MPVGAADVDNPKRPVRGQACDFRGDTAKAAYIAVAASRVCGWTYGVSGTLRVKLVVLRLFQLGVCVTSAAPLTCDHTLLFSPAYEALKTDLAASGEAVQVLVSEGVGLGPFRSHTTALWDWCPHDVSVALDLIGASPRQVDALGCPGDAPEQLSLRLDFPGGASAWIHAGRLSPQRRRTLSVMTERHLYALDEHAEERVTVTPFSFARRHEQGAPDASKRRVVPPASARLPLANAVTYFLDGLAGGDRSRFGTALALEVTRVLAACEAALRARKETAGT